MSNILILGIWMNLAIVYKIIQNGLKHNSSNLIKFKKSYAQSILIKDGSSIRIMASSSEMILKIQ
jgi:hypothetical protein